MRPSQSSASWTETLREIKAAERERKAAELAELRAAAEAEQAWRKRYQGSRPWPLPHVVARVLAHDVHPVAL
jgi:hypothetical protein